MCGDGHHLEVNRALGELLAEMREHLVDLGNGERLSQGLDDWRNEFLLADVERKERIPCQSFAELAEEADKLIGIAVRVSPRHYLSLSVSILSQSRTSRIRGRQPMTDGLLRHSIGRAQFGHR